jgi:hypothetical protein
VPTSSCPATTTRTPASTASPPPADPEGSELFRLPIEDQDVPLLPFSAWAEHEPLLAEALADFMRRVDGSAAR